MTNFYEIIYMYVYNDTGSGPVEKRNTVVENFEYCSGY